MGDKKNLRNKITLGLVLVFLGIMLLLSNGIMERREKVFSKMNLELTELLAHNEESDVKE